MPGGSILITSAPNSASMRAQKGPAMSWPSSITLTPWSGRGCVSMAPDSDIRCGELQYPAMRRAVLVLVVLLLTGCAVHPRRDGVVDFPRFESLPADARVRYEPGGRAHAERVGELLPAAIAQVEAAHY